MPELTQPIVDAIKSYKPVDRNAEAWQEARDDLVDLVGLIGPTDVRDALRMLSNALSLLTWAHPLHGSYDPHVLLTDPWVQRFFFENPTGLKDGTLATTTGRLRRFSRALQGDAAVTRRAPRKGTSKLSISELRLLQQAAEPGTALASILTLTDPRSVDDLQDELWKEARTSAKDCEVDMTKPRLRATLVDRRLREDRPLADLVVTFGLTRRDLENARSSDPVISDEEARRRLRAP